MISQNKIIFSEEAMPEWSLNYVATKSISNDLLVAKHGNTYVNTFRYSEARNLVLCRVYETLSYSTISGGNTMIQAGVDLAYASVIAGVSQAIMRTLGNFSVNSVGVLILQKALEISTTSSKAMFTQISTINNTTYYWTGKTHHYTVVSSMFGNSGLIGTGTITDAYYNDFSGLADRAFEN